MPQPARPYERHSVGQHQVRAGHQVPQPGVPSYLRSHVDVHEYDPPSPPGLEIADDPILCARLVQRVEPYVSDPNSIRGLESIPSLNVGDLDACRVVDRSRDVDHRASAASCHLRARQPLHPSPSFEPRGLASPGTASSD